MSTDTFQSCMWNSKKKNYLKVMVIATSQKKVQEVYGLSVTPN